MLSSQQQQSPYEYDDDDDDDEILRGKYIIIRLVVQDRKVRATVRVANAGETIDGSFLSGNLCSIPVHSLSVILDSHSGDTKNKIKDFLDPVRGNK